MQRPERLRRNPSLRALVEETGLTKNQLVLPLFINDQKSSSHEIKSLPGVRQWSLEASRKLFETAYKQGLRNFILFGVVSNSKKDSIGSQAWAEDGPVVRAIQTFKKDFPDAVLFADCCFCEYTSHGHCGVPLKAARRTSAAAWQRDSEATLKNLARTAVLYAQAGCDIVAPSAALDGMVGAIRQGLNLASLDDTAICSYAVKYASAFYGPFREAAGSAPESGTDRKHYQMHPANTKDALREAELDVSEGADMLLVKPALAYMDILSRVSERVKIPVGAYQVSGEYAMMKAAAKNGWLNENDIFMESLVGLRRAGAQFIISYWALEAAKLLGR